MAKKEKEPIWIAAVVIVLILIAVILFCLKYICGDCDDAEEVLPVQASVADDTRSSRLCPEIYPNPKDYWLYDETEAECRYCMENCHTGYSWWADECWEGFEYVLNRSNHAVLMEPNEINNRFYNYTIKTCRDTGDVDYQIEHVKEVLSDNCMVIKEADNVTKSRIMGTVRAYPDYQKYFVIIEGVYFREFRYIHGTAYCLEDNSICWIINGDTCTYVDLAGGI